MQQRCIWSAMTCLTLTLFAVLAHSQEICETLNAGQYYRNVKVTANFTICIEPSGQRLYFVQTSDVPIAIPFLFNGDCLGVCPPNAPCPPPVRQCSPVNCGNYTPGIPQPMQSLSYYEGLVIHANSTTVFGTCTQEPTGFVPGAVELPTIVTVARQKASCLINSNEASGTLWNNIYCDNSIAMASLCFDSYTQNDDYQCRLPVPGFQILSTQSQPTNMTITNSACRNVNKCVEVTRNSTGAACTSPAQCIGDDGYVTPPPYMGPGRIVSLVIINMTWGNANQSLSMESVTIDNQTSSVMVSPVPNTTWCIWVSSLPHPFNYLLNPLLNCYTVTPGPVLQAVGTADSNYTNPTAQDCGAVVQQYTQAQTLEANPGATIAVALVFAGICVVAILAFHRCADMKHQHHHNILMARGDRVFNAQGPPPNFVAQMPAARSASSGQKEHGD